MQVYRDNIFATVAGIQLGIDIYLPDSSNGRPPLLVYIHGGGWREGSRIRPPFRSLVDEGYALACISHRFTQHAIFPAQVHDCKGAIRWLRANEPRFGYDSSWIASLGVSSGGHLALMLGLTSHVPSLEGNIGGNIEHSSQVQAVVDYFGPTDFVLRAQTQPDIVYTEQVGSFALLGGVMLGEVDKDLEIRASPVHYVTPDAPPLLVFHGLRDKLVLPDQSQAIIRAYQLNGHSPQYLELPGSAHGGVEFFWGKPLEILRQFLAKSREAWIGRS